MRVLELVCGQMSRCFCRFKFWDWPMKWWRCVILDTFCYNLVRFGDQTWFQYLNDVRQCSWSIARFYTWFLHLVMCISSTQVNIMFIGDDRFRMFHVDDLLLTMFIVHQYVVLFVPRWFLYHFCAGSTLAFHSFLELLWDKALFLHVLATSPRNGCVCFT